MNARAWNLFVLAGLLGTLLVLPAASHAAPPATLTAYMKATDVSAVPAVIAGQPDPRQVVFISVQVYIKDGVKNFLGIGTPVTGAVCTDPNTAEHRVVTRKLGPPFPQPLIGPLADIVGTQAAVDLAYGRNYRITSVSLTCDSNLRKVTLQLIQ
jgi:hypothetical protein